MRKKYVYKCVRMIGDKKFCSCSPPSRNLNLRYNLNRWTKAFNGTVGIFVFTTYQDAINWTISGAILKCEYAGEPLRLTRRVDNGMAASAIMGLKSLVSIFSTPEKRRKMIEKVNFSTAWKGFRRYTTHAPYACHVVNAVKPVKIVHPKKFDMPRSYSNVYFTEGKGLPEWMNNKWRIKR